MDKKKKILSYHGVCWYISCNHLYVVSTGIKDLEVCQENIDITDWSVVRLLEWLGY